MTHHRVKFKSHGSGNLYQDLANYMWEAFSIEVDAWTIREIIETYDKHRKEQENLTNIPESS